MSTSSWRHRVLAASLILVWVLLFGGDTAPSVAQAGQAKLYVFAVTTARPRALEQKMEAAMPGVDVTVFGKVGDFESALASAPPDGAMALAPVLQALGQQPALQGTQGGSTTEQYLVLSTKPLDQGSLSGKMVGCIDLVGRRGLPKFVGEMLGTTVRVSRVTKVEDLLPLLQFETADAVLLPERFLAGFRAKSKMDFKVLKLPSARIGCTAVAYPGNRGAVEGGIKQLPGDVKEQIGIDGWK